MCLLETFPLPCPFQLHYPAFLPVLDGRRGVSKDLIRRMFCLSAIEKQGSRCSHPTTQCRRREGDALFPRCNKICPEPSMQRSRANAESAALCHR